MTRTEACACGGSISVALPATAEALAAAVAGHGRTGRHLEWARTGGSTYDPELQGRRTSPMLGPCPCMGCGAHVYWLGRTWSDQHGVAHHCATVRRVI